MLLWVWLMIFNLAIKVYESVLEFWITKCQHRSIMMRSAEYLKVAQGSYEVKVLW